MSTSNIIQTLIKIIKKDFLHRIIPTYKFDDWIVDWNNNYEEIKVKYFDEKSIELPSIKNDALRAIMIDVYSSSMSSNTMKTWDRDYVRDKYEKNINGIDIIYYPSQTPKRIVFNFSSMGKDRYDRYSRYWDPSEEWLDDTVYIFFKDDSYSYYLGNKDTPKAGSYCALIKSFINMNSLNKEQAFTVGGSMGGYGALYYAIVLELNGAIVYSPQTCFKATLAHQYRNWEKHILTMNGTFTDLDMLIHRGGKIPNIYIEYGKYPADLIAVNTLFDELKKYNNFLLIKRKANWEEHTVDTVLSKETVDNTIWYFENNGFIFD